jgi:LytS/YehU family sensor histidine kinase
VLAFLFLNVLSFLGGFLPGATPSEPLLKFEFKSNSKKVGASSDSTPQDAHSSSVKPSEESQTRLFVGPSGRRLSALEDAWSLWFLLSLVLKVAHRGRLHAESIAESARQTAEKADMERQLTEARLSTLQAQLEPHFLFNTLSSIDYLIQTDPNKAGSILRSFIVFLRSSLPAIENSRICPLRPLGSEVALVEAYLQIQKARMEDRLQYSIQIPEGLHSALIPPFMLQTLAENAIKHGLEPQRGGGAVDISASVEHGQLQVTVRDSGVGLGATLATGSGTGLSNLSERLRLLFGQGAQFTLRSEENTGTMAILRIPYST